MNSIELNYHRQNAKDIPIRNLHNIKPHKRLKCLHKIYEINDLEKDIFNSNLFLSFNDLINLDKHPLITIGAHTHRHSYLPALNIFDAFNDIGQSKKILEKLLKHPIFYFSYPYGAHSYKLRLINRLLGFKYAFTTESNSINSLNFSPMAIPRIDLKNSKEIA